MGEPVVFFRTFCNFGWLNMKTHTNFNNSKGPELHLMLACFQSKSGFKMGEFTLNIKKAAWN